MSRIALVTGGTRGIGAAISVALKNAGYKVIANYFSNDEAAKNFSNQNGIPTVKWDVSNYEACQVAIKSIANDYGAPEIVINNAGITRDSMMHKMSIDQWHEVISTNLNSCFNISKCVLDDMRESGFGRIINISSINGQKGQAGQTNYSAAKAGVIGFTKALAQETSTKGITVNAIAPGYIDTEMMLSIPQDVMTNIINAVPVKRLGKPSEIANAVIYLCSDDAGYITGSTININGGQYVS